MVASRVNTIIDERRPAGPSWFLWWVTIAVLAWLAIDNHRLRGDNAQLRLDTLILTDYRTVAGGDAPSEVVIRVHNDGKGWKP